MPELVFKGKEYVYNHHLTVPYRPLLPDPTRSVGAADLAGNLIVHGDNLQALKSLLPHYAGQVDLVFIDPPYNTGNESWSYNDNVNSPLMREWLNSNPVNAEDMLRHDKWLCMMWPRLVLLRELLSERGSFWMTLDDNEIHHARAALDEIFGAENFVATFIWQKVFSPENTAKYVSKDHDYIVCYAKAKSDWTPNLLGRTAEMEGRYQNPDDDPRGPWTSGDLSARNYYGEGTYAITTPSGRVIEGPPKGMYWRVSKENFERLNSEGRIWWGADGDNQPRLKRYLSDVREGRIPQTLWRYDEVGHTQDAKKELLKVLDFESSDRVFVTPKPTELLARIIEIACQDDSLVVDSFAGSGTTAHAVLNANARDGGNRRFILVECENYADTLTAERVRRVIDGYAFEGNQRKELLREKLTWSELKKADALVKRAEALRAEHAPAEDAGELLPGPERRFDKVEIKVVDGELRVDGVRRISEKVDGLGGEFTFCTLGEALDAEKLLSGELLPTFAELGAGLFHLATGATLPRGSAKAREFYLGDAGDRSVWMIYKPDLAFLTSADAALKLSFAERLHAEHGDRRHLVFAPAKFVSNRQLLDLGVEYASLPFALFREH